MMRMPDEKEATEVWPHIAAELICWETRRRGQAGP